MLKKMENLLNASDWTFAWFAPTRLFTYLQKRLCNGAASMAIMPFICTEANVRMLTCSKWLIEAQIVTLTIIISFVDISHGNMLKQNKTKHGNPAECQ